MRRSNFVHSNPHFKYISLLSSLTDQLATIVTDETDVKQVDAASLVFTELLEIFLQHFGSSISRFSII